MKEILEKSFTDHNPESIDWTPSPVIIDPKKIQKDHIYFEEEMSKGFDCCNAIAIYSFWIMIIVVLIASFFSSFFDLEDTVEPEKVEEVFEYIKY